MTPAGYVIRPKPTRTVYEEFGVLKLTRRQLVLSMIGAGLGFPLRTKATAHKKPKVLSGSIVFSQGKREVLEAACERILPGAKEARVITFIDNWMNKEPFIDRLVPHLQRACMHMDRLAQKRYQNKFVKLKPEQQDDILKGFQEGKLQLKNFNGKLVFEHLVRFTLEGFLCDPRHGGNYNMVGHKFIGYHHCWWAPKKLKYPNKPGSLLY